MVLGRRCLTPRRLDSHVRATLSPDQLRDVKKELDNTVASNAHTLLFVLAFVIIIASMSFVPCLIVHHSRTMFPALLVPIKGCVCIVSG